MAAAGSPLMCFICDKTAPVCGWKRAKNIEDFYERLPERSRDAVRFGLLPSGLDLELCAQSAKACEKAKEAERPAAPQRLWRGNGGRTASNLADRP